MSPNARNPKVAFQNLVKFVGGINLDEQDRQFQMTRGGGPEKAAFGKGTLKHLGRTEQAPPPEEVSFELSPQLSAALDKALCDRLRLVAQSGAVVLVPTEGSGSEEGTQPLAPAQRMAWIRERLAGAVWEARQRAFFQRSRPGSGVALTASLHRDAAKLAALRLGLDDKNPAHQEMIQTLAREVTESLKKSELATAIIEGMNPGAERAPIVAPTSESTSR